MATAAKNELDLCFRFLTQAGKTRIDGVRVD